jgi:hypothetical protein
MIAAWVLVSVVGAGLLGARIGSAERRERRMRERERAAARLRSGA